MYRDAPACALYCGLTSYTHCLPGKNTTVVHCIVTFLKQKNDNCRAVVLPKIRHFFSKALQKCFLLFATLFEDEEVDVQEHNPFPSNINCPLLFLFLASPGSSPLPPLLILLQGYFGSWDGAANRFAPVAWFPLPYPIYVLRK